MTMQAHIDKLETQLKHWGETLDALEAKVEAAGNAATFDRRRQLGELQAMYLAAQQQIDAAKVAGSEQWKNLKDGVDSTWAELAHAFKTLDT